MHRDLVAVECLMAGQEAHHVQEEPGYSMLEDLGHHGPGVEEFPCLEAVVC